jgi:hypothetical protein
MDGGIQIAGIYPWAVRVKIFNRKLLKITLFLARPKTRRPGNPGRDGMHQERNLKTCLTHTKFPVIVVF